jgi:hypothetical protein
MANYIGQDSTAGITKKYASQTMASSCVQRKPIASNELRITKSNQFILASTKYLWHHTPALYDIADWPRSHILAAAAVGHQSGSATTRKVLSSICRFQLPDHTPTTR